VQKNKWEPTANIGILKERAKILARIRSFFAERDIIEVETPLLGSASVSDPHLLSMMVPLDSPKYLQTSPEYAMKRLLCAGMGSIYQICKAFRMDEAGKRHNPEFTMLEWYRLGFDHHALMDEMDLFLQQILMTKKAERCTVAEIFMKFLQINPHDASIVELEKCAIQQHLYIEKNNDKDNDKNFWLDVLFSHCIEPHLGHEVPMMIYDYPATQAALAKIRDENPPVASRFEVYIRGIELANGFHELSDAEEQRKRFIKDMKERETKGIASVIVDEKFLKALESGLPHCAGVALGIDRLMMIALQRETIAEVMSFTFEAV
jgi:lysyl-tRNA synthetase class 2